MIIAQPENHKAVAEYLNYLEEFLTYYCKLNYTAVAMQDQSRCVGEKSCAKHKGSSAQKPKIETYIDPFQQSEGESISTTQSQTSVSQATSHQSLLTL